MRNRMFNKLEGNITLPHVINSSVSSTMQPSLIAPKLDNYRRLPNVAVANSQADAQLGMMYPDCLRKRAVPDRHMVVPHEVDHSLLLERDKDRRGIDGHGDIGALLKLKMTRMMKRK